MIEEGLKETISDLNGIMSKALKLLKNTNNELIQKLSPQEYENTKKFMSDYKRLLQEDRAVEAEALKQKFERNGNKL